MLRDLLQRCLDEFNRWFSERGLKISAKKSYCLILDTSRAKTVVQPLKLGNDHIPFVKEFKYLGVTIDNKLSWKPHIHQRISKAKKDLMVARKMIGTDWGLSPDKMAWIYEGIVRPALDYSCHVWTPAGPFPAWLRKELNKLQRLALLCITSCIRTTPTKALERLTNIAPLEHHLQYKASTVVSRIYNSIDKANWDGIGTSNKRGHLFSWLKKLGNLTPVSTTNRLNFTFYNVSFDTKFNNNNLQVYSDGSKISEKVGFGWVIMLGGNVIDQNNRSLPDHCSVFEAEMMAVIYALKDIELNLQVNNFIYDEIDFYVDNQSTLYSINQVKMNSNIKCKLNLALKNFFGQIQSKN